MKDLIKYCMTQHEAEIQKLEQTALGKARFELFIQRWEMNCAPTPRRIYPGQVRHIARLIYNSCRPFSFLPRKIS